MEVGFYPGRYNCADQLESQPKKINGLPWNGRYRRSANVGERVLVPAPKFMSDGRNCAVVPRTPTSDFAPEFGYENARQADTKAVSTQTHRTENLMIAVCGELARKSGAG